MTNPDPTKPDARIETIARRVYEFRWKGEAAWEAEAPEWRRYWIESFAYGLVSDPYTALVRQLQATAEMWRQHADCVQQTNEAMGKRLLLMQEQRAEIDGMLKTAIAEACIQDAPNAANVLMNAAIAVKARIGSAAL